LYRGLGGTLSRLPAAAAPKTIKLSSREAVMPIRLAENFRALFYAPYYAMTALGFYDREGVDVELVTSAAPGAAIEGLFNGTIDIAWAGPMRVIKAHDRDPGSPLVCFSPMVGRDPFYLVGRAGREAFALSALSSLRLATVAEVPTPWLCLAHDLREHGIDPSRLARRGDHTMAANFEALRNRDADVIQVFEPYVAMALQEGIGEILHAASARGPTLYTAFITTRAALCRHRDAFAGMARAVMGMRDWLARHGAEELAQVSAPFFPAVGSDMLAEALARYQAAAIWTADARSSLQGFARLAESLHAGGFISAAAHYEDCVVEELAVTAGTFDPAPAR
jgi:NitT/TauT family transport system substrate-binding protein